MLEGKVLAEARNRAGLTQLEFAKKLGYASAQFISNAERGLCTMPHKKFSKLTKVIGPTAVRKLIAIRVKSYAKELKASL